VPGPAAIEITELAEEQPMRRTVVAHWTIVAVSACLFLLACPARPARALATYDATGTAVLKIVGIDHPGGGQGVVIDGEVFNDVWTDQGGGGSAAGSEVTHVVAANPLDMTVGDSLEQMSNSTGSTTLPGFAISDILTDGYLQIDNTSADAVTVSLELTYEVRAEATATESPEWAIALASVDLFADLAGDLFYDEAYSDTDFDDGLVVFGDTVQFDIVVPPGEFEVVSMFVDTQGLAVPEPTTVMLLLAGLVCWVAVKRGPRVGCHARRIDLQTA
jgi:hypothetical protein